MSDRFGAFRAAQEQQEAQHGNKYAKWAKEAYPAKKKAAGGHGHDHGPGAGKHDKHGDHGHDAHGPKKEKPFIKFEYEKALGTAPFIAFAEKFITENSLDREVLLKDKHELAQIWDRWQTADRAAATMKDFYNNLLRHDLEIHTKDEAEIQAALAGIEAYVNKKALVVERDPSRGSAREAIRKAGLKAKEKLAVLKRVLLLPEVEGYALLEKEEMADEFAPTGAIDVSYLENIEKPRLQLIIDQNDLRKKREDLLQKLGTKKSAGTIRTGRHIVQAEKDTDPEIVAARIDLMNVEREMGEKGIPIEDPTADGLEEIAQKLKDIKEFESHEAQIKKTSKTLKQEAESWRWGGDDEKMIKNASERLQKLEAILNSNSKKEQVQIINELSLRHRYIKGPGIFNALALIDKVDLNILKDDINRLRAGISQEKPVKKYQEQAARILDSAGEPDPAKDRARELERIEKERPALQLAEIKALGLEGRYLDSSGAIKDDVLRNDVSFSVQTLDKRKAMARAIKENLLAFKDAGQSVLEAARETVKKNVEWLVAEEGNIETEKSELQEDVDAWERELPEHSKALAQDEAEFKSRKEAFVIAEDTYKKDLKALKDKPPKDAATVDAERSRLEGEKVRLTGEERDIQDLESRTKRLKKDLEDVSREFAEREKKLAEKVRRSEEILLHYRKAKDSILGYDEPIKADSALKDAADKLEQRHKDRHMAEVKSKADTVVALFADASIKYDDVKKRIAAAKFSLDEIRGVLRKKIQERIDADPKLPLDRMGLAKKLLKELAK